MNGRRNSIGLSVLAALLIGSGASVAGAQDPELGDTGAGGTWGGQGGGGGSAGGGQPQQTWGQPQQQPGGQWGNQQQQQPPPQQPPQQGWGGDTERPPAGQGGQPTADTGASDHSNVVGHVGIGFMGVQSLPAYSGARVAGIPAGGGGNAMPAATVGLRYWLGEKLGLDVGLGFGMTSGSTTTSPSGADDMVADHPSTTGFILHGGLPLVLMHGGHYKFLFIPELDLGFSTGDDGGDTVFTGFLFQVGAELGAEIHFGFIDIPNLAIQATVGLALRFASDQTDMCTAGPPDPCDTTVVVTNADLSIATIQVSEPWDIFSGVGSTLSALYYF